MDGVDVSVEQLTAEHKGTSRFTRESNKKMLSLLPFENKQDFDDARRGFIATLPDGLITGRAKAPVWDISQFSFITPDTRAPETVNPSLWRQSQLANISGLFKVTDGLYQIRNFDLSNMTIVEGETGIIVIDPLLSTETSAAALDLYFQHRPRVPVTAIIYSHSHADHFGGVTGVVDPDVVKAGRVPVIAPKGFMTYAIQENVMAGNAMSRRASYMYGNLLDADPKGNIGSGLGMAMSTGSVSLIAPTDIITREESRVIDGVIFEFMFTPDTEAPSEMHWYIPEYKALSVAENCIHAMHNVYTLRGAKIRDPLAWSKALGKTLLHWGSKAEILYTMHHWPVWGNQRVRETLENQRDLYRFINDQTLRLANHGYTPDEIAELIELPESLALTWSARGYYGSLKHNVKAAYVKYLGYFDGNPAHLDPLPPVEASRRYVEFMGGPDAVVLKAREYFERGEYRWVAQVVNHVVFADPTHQQARLLQADTLEQLGYQAESASWRNFYLTGAQELREGVAKYPMVNTNSPDVVGAMDLPLFFDYVAVCLNGDKARGQTMSFNVEVTDVEEYYHLILENSVLNHVNDYQGKTVDATLILERSVLNHIMLGRTNLEEAIHYGQVEIQGDPKKVIDFLSLLDTFAFWFPIVTP